jgi:hypothetical protein
MAYCFTIAIVVTVFAVIIYFSLPPKEPYSSWELSLKKVQEIDLSSWEHEDGSKRKPWLFEETARKQIQIYNRLPIRAEKPSTVIKARYGAYYELPGAPSRPYTASITLIDYNGNKEHKIKSTHKKATEAMEWCEEQIKYILSFFEIEDPSNLSW